jgi:hypothetical protein
LQEIGSETVERLLEIHKQIAKCGDHIAKSKDHIAKSKDHLAKGEDQLAKGEDQLAKYSDHLKVVRKLLTEAQELCDDGGFDAFGQKISAELGAVAFPRIARNKAKKKVAEETTPLDG